MVRVVARLDAPDDAAHDAGGRDFGFEPAEAPVVLALDRVERRASRPSPPARGRRSSRPSRMMPPATCSPRRQRDDVDSTARRAAPRSATTAATPADTTTGGGSVGQQVANGCSTSRGQAIAVGAARGPRPHPLTGAPAPASAARRASRGGAAIDGAGEGMRRRVPDPAVVVDDDGAGVPSDRSRPSLMAPSRCARAVYGLRAAGATERARNSAASRRASNDSRARASGADRTSTPALSRGGNRRSSR